MSITTCKRCGKLYNKVSSDICPVCVREDEAVFDQIKIYLRSNQNASVTDVVNALGVDEELVIRYLREGRLIANNSKVSYPCAGCGTSIKSGKYCPSCLKNLVGTVNNLKESIKKDADKPQAGYYSH